MFILAYSLIYDQTVGFVAQAHDRVLIYVAWLLFTNSKESIRHGKITYLYFTVQF